jgi:hypothetical protein
VRLDNRRLVNLLGSEPHTPIDDAVCETLTACESVRNCTAPARPLGSRATKST